METIENVTRAGAGRIVAAARGWIGTRFQHQGRLKRAAGHAGGVDCLGLLTGVARELDLRDRAGMPLAAHDRTDYGHIPDSSMLLQFFNTHLWYTDTAAMAEGDILLFLLDGSPRHLAIVSEKSGMPHIIHAYAQARKVVEQPLDPWWRARIHCVFRIP